MTESLMYGSEDQDGKRFPTLSSTTYAQGETPSWAFGINLMSNGDSLN
jgi:hypothetical protein